MKKIYYITKDEAIEIVREWENSNGEANRNLYIHKDGNKIVAIDNTDGQCWVEEFTTLEAARKWLLDEKGA